MIFNKYAQNQLIEIIKENLRNYKQITVIKYHNSNILNTTKSECLVIL